MSLFSRFVHMLKITVFKSFALIAMMTNMISDVLIHQSDLTPFEWIGLFRYSSAIATSTFHGLTFSLIFNKKMAFCF